MHGIAVTFVAALALLFLAPAADAAPFDPSFEALVVVNISAPERVETMVRLRPASISACAGPRVWQVTPQFDELGSRQLAGRAPRWFQFTVEPSVLDSVVVEWETVEILLDEEWAAPALHPQPTSLVLGRRVEVGEVVVLNLRWDPDVQLPSAPEWQPSLALEELAEPPLGGRMYVSEEHSGIVAVHERANGRMVRGLPVGGRPRDMVWDSLRQRLYVVVADRDELLSINAEGRETIVRVPLSFGADATRIIYSEDRQRIAVLAPGRDLLFLFSASSLQELAKIRTGRDPVSLAEDPQSGNLYVTSRTSGQVDVIDPEAARIVATFTNLDSPGEIVRLPSSRFAVGQYRGRRVEVIDPVSGSVQSSMDLCGSIDGLVFIPRLDRLFAVSNICREVVILRPERGLEIGAIRLDRKAGLPSLGPRQAEVYLPLPEAAVVLILPSDHAAAGVELDTGPGPWRVVAP